jgi:hypothetical protein
MEFLISLPEKKTFTPNSSGTVSECSLSLSHPNFVKKILNPNFSSHTQNGYCEKKTMCPFKAILLAHHPCKYVALL